ncbi:MAG: DUF1318 domain-containing protein [Candidatus Omnitrophota bacterium]
MRKQVVLIAVMFIVVLGCARVRVEVPREPIKVDISMRLDIYQHVAQDINDIENLVTGGAPQKNKKANGQSFLNFGVGVAYAQESLSPEVEKAAVNRRDRRPALIAWEEKGVMGENKSGLVEIRDLSKADAAVSALVNAENNDRMVIYQALAKKNNTAVEDVQKIYSQRLQSDAPAGTPVEAVNAAGEAQWRTK